MFPDALITVFTDRATTKGEQIRGWDPHGTGGTKARRGGEGRKTSAIQTESSSIWQLKVKYANRKCWARSLYFSEITNFF